MGPKKNPELNTEIETDLKELKLYRQYMTQIMSQKLVEAKMCYDCSAPRGHYLIGLYRRGC